MWLPQPPSGPGGIAAPYPLAMSNTSYRQVPLTPTGDFAPARKLFDRFNFAVEINAIPDQLAHADPAGFRFCAQPIQ